MSKLSIPDLDALLYASDKYNQDIDFGQNIQAKLALSPGLLSYEEFASILDGAGDADFLTPSQALDFDISITDALGKKIPFVYSQRDLTPQEFVNSYIFHPDHPERLALRHRISDPMPDELSKIWESAGQEPSVFQIGQQGFEDFAWNLVSALPSAAPQSLQQLLEIPESLAYVDWKKVGKDLLEGNPDHAFDAINRGPAKYRKDREKRLSGESFYTKSYGDHLQVLSDLLTSWSQRAMDWHKQDPKNRAYWAWAERASVKDWKDKTGKEMTAWISDVLTSPVYVAGTTGITFLATRNPMLALRAGMTVAYAMEYGDEWNQSYNYYREQGYSKTNANQLANAGALGYAAIATGIEKTSLKVFLNQSLGVKGTRLWKGSLYKKARKNTSDYLEKLAINNPRLKTIPNNFFVRNVKTAVATGTAGAFEEMSQGAAQMMIQAGYMGEDKAQKQFLEGYEEMGKKGFVGEATMGLFFKGLGKIGGPKARAKVDTKVKETPITKMDRDKVKIASIINKVKNLTTSEQKLAGTLGTEERTAESFIKALKKKGPDILNQLDISSKELIKEVKALFGPEIAREAQDILKAVSPPTKEEKGEGKPVTATTSPFGEQGISDEELAAMMADEEIAEDYDAMKGEELKDELRRRKLKVSGKVEELRQRLRDDDATVPAEEEVIEEEEITGEVVYADPETGEPLSAAEIAEIEGEEAPAEDVLTLDKAKELKANIKAQKLDTATARDKYEDNKTDANKIAWHQEKIKLAKLQLQEYGKREAKTLDGKIIIKEAITEGITVETLQQAIKSSEEFLAKQEAPAEEEILQTKSSNDMLNLGLEEDVPIVGEKTIKVRKDGKIVDIAYVKVQDQFVEEKIKDDKNVANNWKDEQLERALGEGYWMPKESLKPKAIEQAPAEGKGPEDQLDIDFQAIEAGKFPKITEDRGMAERIVASLKEKYPEVETLVRNILRNEAGTEISGVSLGAVAAWSRQGAKLDTPPHEYAHIFLRALANDPVIRKAINQFKEKGMTDKQAVEQLVQYIGEYYATNTIAGKSKGFISNFKTFLRKFWVRIKKLLGKPSEYLAEQFFEGGEMFTDILNQRVLGKYLDKRLLTEDQKRDRAKIEAIQAKHEVKLIGTTLKSLQHPLLDTKKPIKINVPFIDAITGIKFSKKEKEGVVYSQYQFGVKAAERELLQQVVLAEGLADTRMTADEFKAVVLKYIYPMTISPGSAVSKPALSVSEMHAAVEELERSGFQERDDWSFEDEVEARREAAFGIESEYSRVTVSGGINYREYTFQFPFKVHGADHDFGTNSIGWFRADELEGDPTVFRVQEIQADILQKAVKREGQIAETAEQEAYIKAFGKGAWDIYFAKSIIQWAATQGYSAVYFPTMKTLAKVEGFISGGGITELNIEEAVEGLARAQVTLSNAQSILEDIQNSEKFKNVLQAVNKWAQGEIDKAKKSFSSGKVKTKFSDPNLQQFGFGMGGLEKGHTITLDDGNEDKYGMGQHTSYWWNEKETQWYIQKHHTSAWTNEGVPIDAEYFTMSYSGTRGWSDAIGKLLHTDVARKKLGEQRHGKPIHADIINAAAEEMIYEDILNKSVPTIRRTKAMDTSLRKSLMIFNQLEDAIIRESDLRASFERLKTTIEHARLAQADVEAGAKENQIDLSNFPDSQATVMKHYRDIRKAMFRDRSDNTEIVVDSRGNTWVKTILTSTDSELEVPLYQMLSPDTEGGRMATRMLDNALNAMQSQLGKRFVVKDFIDRLADVIPSSFAEIFTYWADEHIDMKNVVKGMSIFDAYASPEEVSEAFFDVTDALAVDMANIESNDFAIQAKNMANVDYAFMHALGIDMPKNKINLLVAQARQYAKQRGFTPQEAFEKWANVALKDATGFEYDNIPDTKGPRGGIVQKRRIKQMYVRANSSILVNSSSAKIPRHRNLVYNETGDGLFWKQNTNPFTGKKNDNTAINYLYQAVGADRLWNKPGGGPVWLTISDIIEKKRRGKKEWMDKKSQPLDANQLKALAKKALNLKWDGIGPRIYGLAMLSVRGDSGHFIFAPILKSHVDLSAKLSRLELYWQDQVKAGNITVQQMYHFLGRMKNADGTWRNTPNAADTRWLAGEVARYEMMSNMMPKDLDMKKKAGAMSWMSKGSEFFRRIKILSTPVFTSPLMRDFKSMIIAKGAAKEEIWFVDRNGNEAPMVDVIRGLGKTNRTDGASIIGRTFNNDVQDAFGADPRRKIFKTAIWKADLSLAVKNQMFLPESGMKIIRKKANGERVAIAEVDDTGKIFKVDGDKRVEIDVLMTDDEAKHSSYKAGDVFDVKGNELGLIKYHESKLEKAKFPHQWLNYVHDKSVLAKLRDTIIPRVYTGLDRIFKLTDSDKMRPAILTKYMINLRSDSPHALTTALIEKAKLGLGLHPDAWPMLNKLFKTQIIDPSLQLANGKGAYLDLAPDYFDLHRDNDVSISQADAKQVYKAYAKKEGGTWKDAQNIGLTAINSWLEDNEVRALISRSPIPYIGGVFIGRIKSIHDRGGQIVMSSEHAFRRLEADYDGDAVQVEFLPDEVLDSFDGYLTEAKTDGRMTAVNLKSYKIETEAVNDLSIVENVYNLAQKFQKGARAIGEIANLQNVLGQLQHVFNSINVERGTIKAHKLDSQVHFPEINETKSMEEQLRIWLQAAVDNGKHLLLDEWNYSRDTLIGRLFYLEYPDGKLSTLNEGEIAQVKAIVNKHVIPGRIRNGATPDYRYSVDTLLADSMEYLLYTKNRAARLAEEIGIDESDISFNEELAPLEEIAVSFARMWYGDGNVEARIEPGKITPVQFEQDVYRTVHLNTMRELENDIDNIIQERIDKMDFFELPTRNEATIGPMMKNGRDYANSMWKDAKHGFVKLLEEFSEIMGPSSWDHNAELIDWTSRWSEEFKKLNDLERLSATYSFLRGFAQLAEGKLIYDNNRNVLPPVSDKPNFTVLDHKLMKEYLSRYDTNLREQVERMQDPRNVRYSSFQNIIKKICP